MADIFASGSLVDFILLLVVLEFAAIALLWQSTRRGIHPLNLLPNLLAGAFLLLTLRLSLNGAGWMACCASLAAAGVSHMFDLYRRWKN